MNKDGQMKLMTSNKVIKEDCLVTITDVFLSPKLDGWRVAPNL